MNVGEATIAETDSSTRGINEVDVEGDATVNK